MVIDLRRCVGCYACQVSCKMENSVALGNFRSTVRYVEEDSYPAPKRHFIPKLCNHCENPPCVKACPVSGATYKRNDGVVLVDYDKCTGCGYCVAVCPYGARYIDGVNPEREGKADKCTFCEHRISKGLEPTCVRSCMGRARYFGDLNDPNSKVAKIIKQNQTVVLKPEFNTQPRVYYILKKDMNTVEV